VHSGVVDAVEWAPVGPAAVAVRRNMSCSPCYLSLPKDCIRDLACLKQLRSRDVFDVCRKFLKVRPRDQLTPAPTSAETAIPIGR
jgi:hypothetical protein